MVAHLVPECTKCYRRTDHWAPIRILGQYAVQFVREIAVEFKAPLHYMLTLDFYWLLRICQWFGWSVWPEVEEAFGAYYLTRRSTCHSTVVARFRSQRSWYCFMADDRKCFLWCWVRVGIDKYGGAFRRWCAMVRCTLSTTLQPYDYSS